MNSIRVFLAICCQNGFFMHHYNVDTAFLNGFIAEDVFISPPQGISCAPNYVKLN